MEKTILINEKPIKLKSTAGTILRYKAQFGKDYFSEMLKLSKLMGGKAKSKKKFDLSDISYEDLGQLDFEPLYNFIWVLAKTANPNIPEPMAWLDEFDSMPIAEVFPKIIDLLESSIQTKKK